MANEVKRKPERTLKDDQCGICGCYCFSYPPEPWRTLPTTAEGGVVKACYGCHRDYDGKGIADPAKHYRQKRLYRALVRAKAEVEELEEALEEIG